MASEYLSAHDGRGSPGIDRIELADAWTWGVVVETPTYDLTVFKVHYGKMALKIHNRGERALRIEVIAHNTKAYRWGRSLPCFPEIAARLAGILERFLDAVGCMGACFVSDDTLEKLPAPARIGRTGVGGIDLNKLRMRRVAEAAQALSTSPDGFTASDLVQKVGALPGPSEAEHGPGRAGYDIKKLRAKSMVRKMGKSRRHEPVPEGLRSLTALLVLRDKVIKPLLAARNQPGLTTGPNHPTATDHRYEALRTEMRGLFTELGIAA